MRSLALVLILASSAGAANVAGTLSAIRAEALEVEIKPDSGSPVVVALHPDTRIVRVPPGQKDLKQAVPLRAAELAMGDRVLATLAPDNKTLLRLVVMDAGAIARQHDAERADWDRRGVLGIVASRVGNVIQLKLRGDQQGTVTAGPSTNVRRYRPGSVRFSDAQPSALSELKAGDQVWARGDKDGNRVTANEIVFGTFVTKAGEIVSVDAEASTIRMKDIDSGKLLTVAVRPDSQLKRMPDFGTMTGGGMPPGGMMPPGGAEGGAPPDPSRMLEMLPLARFEDMKPGETLIVSSTTGSQPDQLTAISAVGNAQFLLRMLSMRGRGGPGGPGGPGGMPGGLDGLGMGMLTGMPGMVP